MLAAIPSIQHPASSIFSIVTIQCAIEPGPGKLPIAKCGRAIYFEQIRRLLDAEAPEAPQLNQTDFALVTPTRLLQTGQGFVESQ